MDALIEAFMLDLNTDVSTFCGTLPVPKISIPPLSIPLKPITLPTQRSKSTNCVQKGRPRIHVTDMHKSQKDFDTHAEFKTYQQRIRTQLCRAKNQQRIIDAESRAEDAQRKTEAWKMRAEAAESLLRQLQSC